MRKYIICLIILILCFCGCTPIEQSTQETEAPYCTVLPTNYIPTIVPYKQIITLTDDNFDYYINSHVPVVVDFWFDLCGHCSEFNTIIEELAKHNDGSFIVGKLNIKDYPMISERYNISEAPVIVIFQNGEITYQHAGAISLAELYKLLQN